MRTTRQRLFCFHRSTMVSTPAGPKAVQDVRCGDIILAWDAPVGSSVEVQVERTAVSRHPVLSSVRFANGTELKCTPDHPIWVEGKGWCAVDSSEVKDKYGVNAEDLAVGDSCLLYKSNALRSVKVVGIESRQDEQDFYTISAGDAHCFFANGILVHDENVAMLDLTGTGVRYEDLVSEPA